LPSECRSGSALPAGAMPEEIVPLEEMQHRYLLWALARFQGEKRELAEMLGVSERTLYRKVQEAKRGIT